MNDLSWQQILRDAPLNRWQETHAGHNSSRRYCPIVMKVQMPCTSPCSIMCTSNVYVSFRNLRRDGITRGTTCRAASREGGTWPWNAKRVWFYCINMPTDWLAQFEAFLTGSRQCQVDINVSDSSFRNIDVSDWLRQRFSMHEFRVPINPIVACYMVTIPWLIRCGCLSVS